MELMKTNKTVSAKSRWSFIGGIAGLLLLFLYIQKTIVYDGKEYTFGTIVDPVKLIESL
ncbi:hypothetical protein SAMN04487884_109123 [Butyrivibrio fibrisolvens]|uniref:Uncharacterized protein n=1 Tax=Butyrivibrio fibrisolvens TaxID=831 RepID=A0A1H9RCU3_BUTFI|nr:hypothetical protein SAMN04487884_109123 [Butyrivibrio fibrisolvens]